MCNTFCTFQTSQKSACRRHCCIMGNHIPWNRLCISAILCCVVIGYFEDVGIMLSFSENMVLNFWHCQNCGCQSGHLTYLTDLLLIIFVTDLIFSYANTWKTWNHTLQGVFRGKNPSLHFGKCLPSSMFSALTVCDCTAGAFGEKHVVTLQLRPSRGPGSCFLNKPKTSSFNSC